MGAGTAVAKLSFYRGFQGEQGPGSGCHMAISIMSVLALDSHLLEHVTLLHLEHMTSRIKKILVADWQCIHV